MRFRGLRLSPLQYPAVRRLSSVAVCTWGRNLLKGNGQPSRALSSSRCVVPESDGVFFRLEFRTNLRDKYTTAAPAQRRHYGALANTARQA